jgi:3-dehydroquinate synthase
MQIQSKSHPYDVTEAPSLRDALQSAAQGQRTFALVDAQVHALYPDAFEALPPENVRRIEATEGAKSLDALGPHVEWLLGSGFRRDCLLLVVGGGVLQDLSCFIASTLFRGVRWSLVPTTLLAQCDSCIGSKSSINVGHYKNQMGTFYPPHQVLLAFDVLRSLPPDEVRSGLGEVIKLHLIAGDKAVSRLRPKLAAYEGGGHEAQPSLLSEMVWDSLQIKQRFIEEDEFDQGVRNLLNYGHTFGHAYESATDYAIPHGIAVTLGVLTATFFSSRLGWVTPDYFQSLQDWLVPYYAPYQKTLLGADPERILAAMRLDKKNTGDTLGCILTRGAGRMEKTKLSFEGQVRPLLAGALAQIGAAR